MIRWRSRERRDERGAATVFVVGMSIVLLACSGLVVDGGGALNARMKLADEVEQAARAGAQQIDEVQLRKYGRVRLNQPVAEQRAEDYLRGLGHPNAVATATPTAITVTADDVVQPTLLSLIGVPPFDIHATATAEAETR